MCDLPFHEFIINLPLKILKLIVEKILADSDVSIFLIWIFSLILFIKLHYELIHLDENVFRFLRHTRTYLRKTERPG